jgi:hypothetical protein
MYWSTSARKTKRTAPISESNKGRVYSDKVYRRVDTGGCVIVSIGHHYFCRRFLAGSKRQIGTGYAAIQDLPAPRVVSYKRTAGPPSPLYRSLCDKLDTL